MLATIHPAKNRNIFTLLVMHSVTKPTAEKPQINNCDREIALSVPMQYSKRADHGMVVMYSKL